MVNDLGSRAKQLVVLPCPPSLPHPTHGQTAYLSYSIVNKMAKHRRSKQTQRDTESERKGKRRCPLLLESLNKKPSVAYKNQLLEGCLVF